MGRPRTAMSPQARVKTKAVRLSGSRYQGLLRETGRRDKGEESGAGCELGRQSGAMYNLENGFVRLGMMGAIELTHVDFVLIEGPRDYGSSVQEHESQIR